MIDPQTYGVTWLSGAVLTGLVFQLVADDVAHAVRHQAPFRGLTPRHLARLVGRAALVLSIVWPLTWAAGLLLVISGACGGPPSSGRPPGGPHDGAAGV